MIKGVNAQAVQDTTDEQIDAIYKELRESFNTDRTLSLSFRKTMLSSFKRGLIKYESEILAALKSDLNNSPIEAYLANVLILHKEIEFAMDNLSDWCKPEKRKTPMHLYPAKSYVKPQARGVALVIGSWNYPLNTLAPAISAIAAGNAVLMKPSEHSPASSKIFKKLCDEFLDTRFYRVVEGGIPTGTKVTSLPVDIICFTGSTYVGKIIARAAAANLTPCILELGGKCPTIIDHTANLDIAAKRVVSTKFMNAGQTCIAPDYVFVHPKVKTEFINKVKQNINTFYSQNPKTCPSYSRLIHKIHTERCAKLLDGHKDKIIHGNVDQIDLNACFIPPIVIDSPSMNSDLMKEEIFGPILPIITYEKPQDIIDHIKSNPRPLAVYYYGNPDSVVCERLQERTISGAFVTNDCVMQAANSQLPFGGVGDSGYGTTHGRDGFMQMSHLRSFLIKPNSKFLDLPDRYPKNQDPEKSLKEFKKLQFVTSIYFEDVMCWTKAIVGVGLLVVAFILLQKYGFIDVKVSFPKFQKN